MVVQEENMVAWTRVMMTGMGEKRWELGFVLKSSQLDLLMDGLRDVKSVKDGTTSFLA